jgi:ATP-dependent DNA helicase RecG
MTGCNGSARQESAESDELRRLERYGVSAWHQVLLCLPKGYVTHPAVSALRTAMPSDGVVGERRTFALIVTEAPVVLKAPRKRIVVQATDGMLSVRLTVFVDKKIDVAYWRQLAVGDRIHVAGALQTWGGRLQINGPVPVVESDIGRTFPEYESIRGVVSASAIFAATRKALQLHLGETVEYVRQALKPLREAEVLSMIGESWSIERLLAVVHGPSDAVEADRALTAMRRLAALSVVLTARAMKNRSAAPESVVPIAEDSIDRLIAQLPFPLTNDQKRTIDEVVSDLRSDRPMRRLISGDVGTGKTICIMIPALAMQAMGKRVAILTPNIFLAEQFVAEAKEAFGAHTNVRMIAGKKAGPLHLEGNPVLVGTTAILSRLTGEWAPNLCVVDEQQRFSVAQKEALLRSTTNYLEATATPIPRTTALITHGALDVSVIRESPVRKSIETRIVEQGEVRRLFDHTRRVVERGGQVAIVYPIVRDDEQERKSVVRAYDRWNAEFPNDVCMIHGGLSDEEKLEAVSRFKAGAQKIGVVSSVIELGITVPDLRSLIVMSPERYGASTLHQLRGRVARKGGTGHFFMLLQGKVSPETMERLRLVEDLDDGFLLAEQDAKVRGYGDLFEAAEKQHGRSRSSLFFNAHISPQDINALQGLL